MGFYTYTKAGSGVNLGVEFVAWLNEHGVTCTLTGGTTLDIADFNGMKFNLTSGFFSETTSYTHIFTLVTDPGKEMILICGRQDGKTSIKDRYARVDLIVNYNGGRLVHLGSAKYISISSYPSIPFNYSNSIYSDVSYDTTGDIYLVPWMDYWGNAGVIIQNYYFSMSKVEVPAGTIISDGTKQFISCGMFLYVEYDPATMSA